MPHPGAHLHSVEWAGAAGTAGSDAMWELLAGALEKFDRMHESTDHRFFVDNAEKTAVDIVDETAGCIHVSLHVAPSPPPLLVQQSLSYGKKVCGQLRELVARMKPAFEDELGFSTFCTTGTILCFWTGMCT